jgi:flagellar basal-body rod modification protein FlgD
MAVTAVTPLPPAPKAGEATTRTGRSETEDRFLTLLVTQLRNQDPLNPLDNAQVTSQLAQLSTVTGIERLNTTMGAVLASLAQQQGLAAAGLAGSRVAVQGDALSLAGGAATGGYSLEQPAESVVVTITDSTGRVVRTLDLGARRAGIATFEWDGKDAAGKVLADGDYKMSVAAHAGGKPVAITALSVAVVQGVIPASDGFALNLGAAGVVPYQSVVQILPNPTR